MQRDMGWMKDCLSHIIQQRDLPLNKIWPFMLTRAAENKSKKRFLIRGLLYDTLMCNYNLSNPIPCLHS